jgi:stage II sporulation protein AA (anti-sigma F factor antagonist)
MDDQALIDIDINIGVGIRIAGVGSDATVARVCGEIDLLTAPILRAALDEQFDSSPPVLVIDLNGVTFLGACGVEVLIEASERAARAATALRLVYRTRAVARPLEVLDLDGLFARYLELVAALAA